MRNIDAEKLRRMNDYIHEYAFHHNGDVPVLSEIMAYMGMSRATAYRYLLRLNEQESIDYHGKGTLHLKEKTNATKKYRSVRVPIYGAIVCGSPEEEEQQGEGYLAIPEEWVEGECFLLRAHGDSMTDIGIDHGDLVLIQRTNEANDGQVIVALTEDGTTLKRLSRENGKPILLAENRAYPPERRVIRPAHLEIQGIARKIMKDVH